MNFLPIVHRELRIASRKRGTYISRVVVAGIVVLLWLTLSAANARQMSVSELAKNLFWTYGILAMVYALLSGVFFTADSLSAERREGTLGLLFLTDLKGFDVVLGKLAATSWHGVYSLLVIVPVLALPLLMGGVSHMEMARLVVVILFSLFYSLALGLLVSTLCRRLVTAVAVTFVIILAQCSLPWIVAALSDEVLGWSAEKNPIIWLCPFTSLAFLPDISYRSLRGMGPFISGQVLFWVPVVVTAGLGGLCLGMSCWLLPRIWQREQQPPPSRLPVRSTDGGASGDEPPVVNQWRGAGLSGVCQPVLEVNPYGWMAQREGGYNRWLTLGCGLLCLVLLFFLVLSSVDGVEDVAFSVAFFGAFALHVMVKGGLALESSRRLCEGRQSGALELLLVTPIRVRDVVQGELAAIKQSFGTPMGLTFTVNLVLLIVILVFDPVHMHKDRWWFSEIVLWGGLILWLDAKAIVYTGMLAGLKATRHHRAVLGSIGRVLLPPWVGVALFFLLVALPGSNFSEEAFVFCMRVWFAISLLLDLVLIQYAKSKLHQNLRALLAGEKPTSGIAAEPSVSVHGAPVP